MSAERARVSKIIASTSAKMIREESRRLGFPEPDGDYPGLADNIAAVVDTMSEAAVGNLAAADEGVVESVVRKLLGPSIKSMVRQTVYGSPGECGEES